MKPKCPVLLIIAALLLAAAQVVAIPPATYPWWMNWLSLWNDFHYPGHLGPSSIALIASPFALSSVLVLASPFAHLAIRASRAIKILALACSILSTLGIGLLLFVLPEGLASWIAAILNLLGLLALKRPRPIESGTLGQSPAD